VRSGPLWVAGVATGVAAYGVQALFLFPVAELDPVAWLLAGLVAARVARRAELVRLRPPRLVPVLAAAGAVVALAAGILDVAADRVARRTLAAIADDRPTDGGAAARLRPDAVRYRLVAARAHLAGTAPGSRRQALAELDRALDVSPKDPVAGAERARLLLDRARLTGDSADVAAARAALQTLVRLDPRNAELQLRLGIALDLAGDARGAERAWREAEWLAPASAAGSTNLALAYAKGGRWDEAKAAAERALERDPEDARARGVLEQAEQATQPDGT